MHSLNQMNKMSSLWPGLSICPAQERHMCDPKSGRKASFPEVDRAQWFSPAEARQKILKGQSEFITRLLKAIGK